MAIQKGFSADTVAELIECLKEFPPDALWYGWDDEAVIIRTKDDPSPIGWIDPHRRDR